jgi:phenylalanyl-tRNA synthetase alpha subunit
MKQTKNISIAIITNILLCTSLISGNTVTVEISYGELVDKITILTIKSERITNKEKLKNIQTELETLQKAYDDYVGNRLDITQLQKLLKKINESLWDIEDAIRIKERNKEFDDEFTEIARSVYTTNDERCAIKKKIDLLLGSHITEEKSYEEFTA